MAAETLHEGTEVAPEAGQHKAFPPLDPANITPLLFWFALSFAALYFMMSRFALPRIRDVIEERADRIKRDLDAAERLKGETEKALAAYEKALADARANASGIARQTRDKLAAETDAEKNKVDGSLSAKLADAEKSIAATKTKALASVSEIAADTAGEIVRRLSGKDVSLDEVKRALAPAAGE